MKGQLTKRRFKARKGSSCALCKPYKHKAEDKKSIQDLRQAVKHEQELSGRSESA